MEPRTKVQHVVPHEGKWGIRAENSEIPSKIFELKMNAVMGAFDIADKREGKIVIHNIDGTFKEIDVTEETSRLLTALRA